MKKLRTPIKDQEGFTLVELLIAVVFLAILLLVITSTIITLLATYRQIKTQDFVQRESVYVAQVLERGALGASKVTTSQGNNLHWEVGPDYKPSGGRDLEAICFDNTAFVLIWEVRNPEGKNGNPIASYRAGVANNPLHSPLYGQTLLKNADAYSLGNLPIDDFDDCDPYEWGVNYDIQEVYGTGGNYFIDSNTLGIEIVAGGDGLLLRFDATVIDGGRRLAVEYQIGSSKDIVTSYRDSTADKDVQIFEDMEKDASGSFRCKPQANNIDSCWVETKRFVLNTGRVGN